MMKVSKADTLTTLPGCDVLEVPLRHEPRGPIGRYLLAESSRLGNMRLTSRVVPPAELARINDANRDTWSPLISALDHREFPMAAEEFNSVVIYDADGSAIATCGQRLIDLTGTTAYAELTNLNLWYGERSAAMRSSVTCEITSPTAHDITGPIIYSGGVWVHPNYRRANLTGRVVKLTRYLSLAKWEFNFEVALASAVLLRPELLRAYGVERCEHGYALKFNGSVKYDGVMNFTSRDFIIETLLDDVRDDHPAIDSRQSASLANSSDSVPVASTNGTERRS